MIKVLMSTDGKTALSIAIGKGYTEIADYVRAHGAKE
jgi:hypothetical protein